ncbi:uncharacterized protein LOC121377204 isoform X2 [Gigantopelta aegis]|uniref:uncharacterized protein LOC121377204 isoform X2 n=1 Tax=Gigantopelta aegis TaxID=1735272 RepID=UPI001B88AF91|nr:uncharacterized protein LOC121377204 isoform X2 [Gigantopelta aegis]
MPMTSHLPRSEEKSFKFCHLFYLETRDMKLAVALVVVFAFVLTAKHGTATGSTAGPTTPGKATTTTTDCMGPGIEGQKTEIKCKITGTVQSGIQWIGPLNKSVVTCNYLQTVCATSGEFTDHYTGVIDSPQQNTLVIKSFDPKTDVGTWTCYDGWGARRSYCNKSSGN